MPTQTTVKILRIACLLSKVFSEHLLSQQPPLCFDPVNDTERFLVERMAMLFGSSRYLVGWTMFHENRKVWQGRTADVYRVGTVNEFKETWEGKSNRYDVGFKAA